MKLKTIAIIISITITVILDYVPIEAAITIYTMIGVTIGALNVKANRWARDGIVNVVGGAIIAILIVQVLPSVIDDAAQGLDGFEITLLKFIPHILKFAIIWVAFRSVLEKLGRISWE